jgi:hypothetical protein
MHFSTSRKWHELQFTLADLGLEVFAGRPPGFRAVPIVLLCPGLSRRIETGKSGGIRDLVIPDTIQGIEVSLISAGALLADMKEAAVKRRCNAIAR